MRMTAPRSRRVPVALVCLITLTSMYLQSLTFSMPKPTGDGEREDSDPVVGFGKHKGLKFSELMEEHPDYVEWVMAEAAQGDGSSNRNFQKLADFLAKQRDVNGTAAVMA
mmetsp:Transcript_37036/g.85601  ORF Transcript_37036/g.85601 Transcript_37036/m.85601 type:complete len:110 (-) Transcript_37036:163-492(-)